jgi:hypothetical protein
MSARKPTLAAPRPLNHPGVRTVMTALNRAAKSPDKDVYITVAGIIAELGSTIGRFEECGVGEWSLEGVRALLLAQARYAPAPEFNEMVQQAKYQLRWLEWWDVPGGGMDQAQVPGGATWLLNYVECPA